jgi:quinol monooxygenase YgiN
LRHFLFLAQSRREEVMTQVFIRHRVGNYAVWKQVFDAFSPQRKAAGELSYKIAHPHGEATHLFLWFAWDSEDNAKAFLDSPELADAMRRAGVSEKPDIRILTEVASGSP